jgi:P27 family predicted phage terminase small subunit
VHRFFSLNLGFLGVAMGNRQSNTAAQPEPLPPPPPPRLIARARLKPPVYLTPEQKKEWRAITNSLPADYFKPSDVPLLAAFCCAATFYKQAAAEVARDGVTVEVVGKGRRMAHPAANMLVTQSSAMAQLAVKLRLCPSSRYDEKTAATKANASKDAKRPWEN